MDNEHEPVIDVVPYSIEMLGEVFEREAKATKKTLAEKKLHLAYFEEYFKELDAKTIVIERHYTDRDWLEDYADFYVRCLERYKSRCTRLHFFNIEFSHEDLRNAIANPKHPLAVDIQAQEANGSTTHYLGFIIVKPLPKSFIGRTCLRTYPSTPNDERHYPITVNCESHLLGFDLSLQSLPFQEQDTVAAACATSALWSALHATARLFHHPVLSPIEITHNATATLPSSGRDVPSHGLSMFQMADAVRRVGLAPEILPMADSGAFLRTTARAYLAVGIPLVIMGYLIDHRGSQPRYYKNAPNVAHAVTITGYRAESGIQSYFTTPSDGQETELEALRISELYVHDDQVGPFARVRFEDKPIKVTRPEGRFDEFRYHLWTSWHAPDGSSDKVSFAPRSVLLPLYHKIRLPIRDVLTRYVFLQDKGMEKKRSSLNQSFQNRLCWDIELTTNATLRRRLRNNDLLPEAEKIELLESAWPRFIWQVSARYEGRALLTFLLDATDIPKGNYVLTRQPLVFDPRVDDLLLDDPG